MIHLLYSTIFYFFIINPHFSYACSVCFYGDPSQKQNIALFWSVSGLLIFLLIPIFFILKFIYNFHKREMTLNKK